MSIEGPYVIADGEFEGYWLELLKFAGPYAAFGGAVLDEIMAATQPTAGSVQVTSSAFFANIKALDDSIPNLVSSRTRTILNPDMEKIRDEVTDCTNLLLEFGADRSKTANLTQIQDRMGTAETDLKVILSSSESTQFDYCFTALACAVWSLRIASKSAQGVNPNIIRDFVHDELESFLSFENGAIVTSVRIGIKRVIATEEVFLFDPEPPGTYATQFFIYLDYSALPYVVYRDMFIPGGGHRITPRRNQWEAKTTELGHGEVAQETNAPFEDCFQAARNLLTVR